MRKEGLRFDETADQLIDVVIKSLGAFDDSNGEAIEDKADRILETIDRHGCDIRDHDKRRQRYDYLAKAEAFRNKQANKQPMTQADPTEVADWLLTAPFSILGHDADTIFILPEVSGVVQRSALIRCFKSPPCGCSPSWLLA